MATVRSLDHMTPIASSLARAAALVALAVLPVPALPAAAALPGPEAAASVRILVRDVLGGVLPSASVSLLRQGTGARHDAVTGADGALAATIPSGVYDLRVEFPGFSPYRRRVDLPAGARTDLDVLLEPAGARVAVSVAPAAADEGASAGTRHDARRDEIERVPAAVGSRGLESVLVSFPGFAQNANGAIHPRGAHNQMTYVIDGLLDQRPAHRRLRQCPRRRRSCRFGRSC